MTGPSQVKRSTGPESGGQPRTFAELPNPTEPVVPTRCPVCGDPVDTHDRVRINLHAGRHGKGSEWLYRRAAMVCEACAVRAILAAVEVLGEQNLTATRVRKPRSRTLTDGGTA